MINSSRFSTYNSEEQGRRRLRAVSVVFLLLALAIIVRLFILQILEYNYYSTFALSTHEIYQKLHAKRGQIYFGDARTGAANPAAINRDYYLVYAVPRELTVGDVPEIVEYLNEIFKFSEEQKTELTAKLSKFDDPYEVVAKKVDDATLEKVKSGNLKGIYYVKQEYRYYPEKDLASNVLGFCGFDDAGNIVGSYGLEGYWNKILAGEGGFLSAERGRGGGWIVLASREMTAAQDGADLYLTIDRNLENFACERLKTGMKDYNAKSAALVLMEPSSGAVLAMCSFPDFDPNEYSSAKLEDYNNTTIFTQYEPGSVFKPITMSMGLDAGIISPRTPFTDPCLRKIDGHEIRNALEKCYGRVDMTGVLENSINTGMIWLEEQLGRKSFFEYTQKFGFGEKTGVELNTEMPGNISSLEKKSQIYGAVASFGQGITATPLQLAVAYSALASEGRLPRPYIVKEAVYPDGRREKTQPKVVETVISPRAAKLLTGMMVSVVENGHGKPARLKNYFLAGKTGTAQIPGPGGYTEETNHTFAGFAPASSPRFVLVVKYEAPDQLWAESTAAPVFKDVMQFALEYAGVPKER